MSRGIFTLIKISMFSGNFLSHIIFASYNSQFLWRKIVQLTIVDKVKKDSLKCWKIFDENFSMDERSLLNLG